mmetsp:Transcript_7067/g.12230  ORF Transcript_7067/g.12230 Transcript_7067/m.12230 type:complete len:158 (-) Transcript_7067:165-638(-)
MAGIFEGKLVNPSEAWVHLFPGDPSKVMERGSAPLAFALLAAFVVMDVDNASFSLSMVPGAQLAKFGLKSRSGRRIVGRYMEPPERGESRLRTTFDYSPAATFDRGVAGGFGLATSLRCCRDIRRSHGATPLWAAWKRRTTESLSCREGLGEKSLAR